MAKQPTRYREVVLTSSDSAACQHRLVRNSGSCRTLRYRHMNAIHKFQRIGAAFPAIFITLCLVVTEQAGSPSSARGLAQRGDQATVAPRKDYAAAVAMLERFVTHEMADKDLPAISIALVDDQQI